MEAFELADLIARQQASGSPYYEFLRVPALSVGLYVLPAGGVDHQQPHTEDEVYYVASGRGQIRVGDEDRPVQAGSVIFVAAGVDHRFHSITEDLKIIVFFAPAEYSKRASGEGPESPHL
ncbi:MAG: cupin domain-containing protein [Chloroflexota bacterium]|nr:MAG: cupin domain-containing protein [Chloroflexota bacterium]